MRTACLDVQGTYSQLPKRAEPDPDDAADDRPAEPLAGRGATRARTIRFQETVGVVMCLLSDSSGMSTGSHGPLHEDDDVRDDAKDDDAQYSTRLGGRESFS